MRGEGQAAGHYTEALCAFEFFPLSCGPWCQFYGSTTVANKVKYRFCNKMGERVMISNKRRAENSGNNNR